MRRSQPSPFEPNPRLRPSRASVAMVVSVLWMSTSGLFAQDCPRPLVTMPTVVDDAGEHFVRRQAVELTETRLVYADYMRSRSWHSEIVDIGIGWLENPSDVRRRIRYHHEFPIDQRPMIVIGTLATGSTRPATFDLRIGCDPLDDRAFFHVVEGEADRFVLRVEAVLEPGQRVALWWNVNLEIAVAGRLPNDRNGDGTVDLEDLSVALSTLGRDDPAHEAEALRSLVAALGE